MMKNNSNLIIVIILTISMYSCLFAKQKDRLEVYGYALGDTLTNDFEITKVQDFPFSRAVFNADPRFEVHLINNRISSIELNDLTPEEHLDYKLSITDKMNFVPEYYKDTTPFNVKAKGEMYYWHDSLTGLNVVLSRNTKLSHLSIYNVRNADSIINEYLPSADTNKLELMIFEEE